MVGGGGSGCVCVVGWADGTSVKEGEEGGGFVLSVVALGSLLLGVNHESVHTQGPYLHIQGVYGARGGHAQQGTYLTLLFT
jgi:hypothetical protein